MCITPEQLIDKALKYANELYKERKSATYIRFKIEKRFPELLDYEIDAIIDGILDA